MTAQPELITTVLGRIALIAKVRIDPGQQHDLAQALVHDLDITVGDD
ncbi:hypothetical protein [Streptomyces sp. bgisy060]